MIDLYDKLFRKQGYTLEYVLPSCITEELCHMAVFRDGMNMTCVPERYATQELWEYAIMKDPRVILYIPDKYASSNLYKYAIKRISRWHQLRNDKKQIIMNIPDKYMTTEFVKFILDTIGDCTVIPKKYMTNELYKYYFSLNSGHIGDIPDKYVTKDMWLQFIKQIHYYSYYTDSLEYVPEDIWTHNLAEEVLSKGIIKYVPEQYITKEWCEKILEKSYYNIRYIPQKFITKELLEKYPKIVEYLKKDQILDFPEYIEMCYSLLKSDKYYKFDISKIPEKYITEDLCKKYIETHDRFSKTNPLSCVPTEYLTQGFYEFAVKNNLSLKYVPFTYKTDKVIQLALDCCSINIAHVPKNKLTDAMCEKAMTECPWYISTIPDEFKTNRLCEIATGLARYIDSNDALQHVPQKFKTRGLCMKALEHCPDCFYYFPDEYITPELLDESLDWGGPYDGYNIPYKLYTKERCEVIIDNCTADLEEIPYKFLTKELSLIALKETDIHQLKEIKDTIPLYLR